MGSDRSKTESSSTQDVLRSPAEVTAEFQAALPGILGAVQEFQPQFDQTALESLMQFGPQFAQAQRDIFAGTSPFQAQLPELLSQQAIQRSTEGLTPDELELFSNRFKSLVGNQVNAPIGASAIGRGLIEQQLAAKQQGQQLGLALAGGVPNFASGFNPQGFSVGSAFSPVFSSQVFGAQGTSSQTTTQTPSVMNQIGTLAGAAGGVMTGIGSLGTANATSGILEKLLKGV